VRLALFGGAFDPIHNAHIRIAKEALRECGLDQLLLVPAANPPHKRMHAGYEDRYRMVELAVENQPGLTASRLEDGTAQSFSIDTIEKLKKELGAGDKLFFLIGADAFADIQTWKRWRDVVREADFIVVSRPGHRYNIPEGARVERLDSVELVVSSSEIRERLAAGDQQVDAPRAVLYYIREKNLYADSAVTP
jgi:nicotinate-nucleotide adenylyltransferase